MAVAGLKRRKPVFAAPKIDTGVGKPPVSWTGSDTEWFVYKELVYTHKMKLNEDFTYQSELTTTGGLPGRAELGGLIADFIIEARRIVINPLSDYYHYATPNAIAREKLNRELLAQQGLDVIWIDSGDIDKDAKFYVTEALNMRDWSRMAQGLV